ncbi:MAG: RodZ domain-containing protein [Pseudomonadota bacterium]|nr:RodZ domain-containing protein [Pseudomonadota bacterium]
MRILGEKSDAQGTASNDGAEAMTVGRYLKSQREQRGEDVTQVADMLRIHRSYLQAIEESDIEKLPGPTYAVGFVRAYAEYLGLDGAQVADRFKEEGKVKASRTPLVLPSPLPEGRIPSGTILLVAVILLAVAYGGWVFVSSSNDEIAGMVPSLPERLASLVGSDEAETPSPEKPEREEPAAATETTPIPVTVKAAAPAPEEKSPTPPAENKKAAVAEPKPAVTPETTTETEAASPKVTKPTSTENASDTPQVASASGTDKVNDSKPETSTEMASSDPTMSEQTPVAKPAKTATAGTATAEKVATAKPAMTDDLNAAAAMATGEGAAKGQAAENEDGTRVYGDPDGGSRVVIRAAEDSWVEVRDGEGELLLTRVLREGDRYHVPNRASLTLVTGNAGALKFSVDGDEVADIGRPGTVRRNVRLDPQALKDGTAHTR